MPRVRNLGQKCEKENIFIQQWGDMSKSRNYLPFRDRKKWHILEGWGIRLVWGDRQKKYLSSVSKEEGEDREETAHCPYSATASWGDMLLLPQQQTKCC